MPNQGEQGNFLTTVLVNQESEGTASVTITKDLPRANFIAGILIKMKTAGTSPTATLTRVQILGNGAAGIVDLTGDELQKLNRFLQGTAAPTNGDASAEADYFIPFQRFAGDVDCLLPAKLFRTLQLRMQWTAGGTWTSSTLDVHVIEYVGNDAADPYTKWCFQYTEVAGAVASAASGTKDVSLPIGTLMRHFLINATGTDGTTVPQVTVRINNGAEIPTDMRWEALRRLAELTRSGLGAVANWAFVDYDPDKSLAYALQSAGANDIVIRLTQGAGSQTYSVVLSAAVLIPRPN